MRPAWALGNPVALSLTPKANRKEPRETDFALYRERNLVERFFCKLKQYRAISTRYDKLANTFLVAVALVCVLFCNRGKTPGNRAQPDRMRAGSPATIGAPGTPRRAPR
jgi:hypothetical protein